MLRQASSRNQRAKGFRLKHALQIGILVAICIWLVYQVKHSHEKKIAYDAKNSKLINKVTDNRDDFFQFGRKELRNEAGTINEIQKEEETEEAKGEGEPEVMLEEPEDEEVRGAGDDEIDDRDQETTQKAERREDSDEVYDKDVRIEEKVLFENLDHEGGTQAAREENYNRDDASSAVVHEESETVKGDASSMNEDHVVEHSKVDGAGENLEKKETGAEDVSRTGDSGTIEGSRDGVSDLLVKDNGTKTDDSRAKNGTTAESKESDAESSKADNGLILNSTTIASTESKIELELPTNSTSVSGNQTEGQHNSTLLELDGQVEMSNSTVSLDSVRDGNATDEKGTSLEVESNVVDLAGKSVSISKLDLKEHEHEHEHATSSSTENGDATALPNIQTEAKTMDQEAAE